MIDVDKMANAIMREYPKLKRVLLQIDDYNVITTILILALADHVENMPISDEQKEKFIDKLSYAVRDAIEKKMFDD